MDELGRIGCEEFSNALKSLSEALNRYSIYGYDALYSAIASLSSIEFADKVVSIVGAEYNIYDRFVMYTRMQNVIDLLAYGVCKEDVDKLLQTQTDDIAIKLIRGGF